MSNSNTRPAHTVKGFRTSFTRNCLSNALAFMVESMLDGNINTADVVQVKAVHAGGPTASTRIGSAYEERGKIW